MKKALCRVAASLAVSLSLAAADDVCVSATDSAKRHVYAPGETISVTLRPSFMLGAKLKDEIAGVELKASPKAYKLEGAEKAMSLLDPGAPSQKGAAKNDVEADFYGVKDPKRALVFEISLKSPMNVLSARVLGKNASPNHSVKGGSVEAEGESFPMLLQEGGSEWRLSWASMKGVSTQSLSLRVEVPYKACVTGLQVYGVSVDANPTRADWAPPRLFAEWTDWRGNALSERKALENPFSDSEFKLSLKAPGSVSLRVSAEDEGGNRIYNKEFGFFVKPSFIDGAPASSSSQLGMVHPDLSDLNLKYRWSKSVQAVDGPVNPEKWREKIARVRESGHEEVVLFSNGTWKSDPTQAVGEEQLKKLGELAESYFKAQPDVLYWELGLEENLGWRRKKSEWPHYWPNLKAKTKAVREAAARVNPEIKLLYQIAELDMPSVKAFFESEAPEQFDILSLHPYAWSKFPDPETWMPDFLAKVRAEMAKSSRPGMPIWFTEIGQPHNGNPGGFFGYPSKKAFVKGATREEAAAYMVKCHCVAFENGVEKVFWYNYRDRGSDPEYAEDHFGLVDFLGFPKPVYCAYATMSSFMDGGKFAESKNENGLFSCKFEGAGKAVWIAWSSREGAPAGFAELAKLAKIPSGAKLRLCDATGAPLEKASLALGRLPVFVYEE